MASRQQLIGVWIAILIVGIAAIIGWASPAPFHNNVSLGQWKNFPSSCVSDDSCELMFNTTYRGLLSVRSANGASGISVGLEVGCITPSNTLGATLQLQYAQYIDGSTHANFTTFVNIGTALKIDNSAGWPCPGVLTDAAGTIPPYNPNSPCCIELYEFRVLGKGGGGVGDNPRFSFAHVYVNQIAQSVISVNAKQKTLGAATGFIWSSAASLPLQSTTTITVSWFATNVTSTGCGVISGIIDVCDQAGTSTDSIPSGGVLGNSVTVNYAVVFTGTVKTLVTAQNPNMPTQSIYVGDIDLFAAQTLTV